MSAAQGPRRRSAGRFFPPATPPLAQGRVCQVVAGPVAQELVEAAGEGGLRRDDVVGDGRLHQSRLRQHQAVVGGDVYHLLGPRVLKGALHVLHPDEGALLGAETVGLRVVRALVRQRLAVRVGQP